MAITRNVCYLTTGVEVGSVAKSAYPLLTGLSSDANILKIGGRHMWFYTNTGFDTDLANNASAEVLLVAQDWTPQTGTTTKNSAALIFVTKITNFGASNNNVRGIIAGIRLRGAGNDPDVRINAFRIINGLVTLGVSIGADTVTESSFVANEAVKLYAEMISTKINVTVTRTSDNVIIYSASFDCDSAYFSLTGAHLPESGYYVGSSSGLQAGGINQQTDGSLMFLDRFLGRVG